MSEKKAIINDMFKNNAVVNKPIANTILQNPFIRDLPNMAALCGLYSRFLVGAEDVYFVFGFNKEVVYGKFIEARDSMISEAVVKKCGYFVPEKDAPNVICLDCEARKLTGDTSEILNEIRSIVGKMDYFGARLKRHKLKFPPYIYFDLKDMDLNCMSMVDNPAVVNNHAKQTAWRSEEKDLIACMIPEWPIHPKGEKPGFLAFMASRYMPNDISYRKLQGLYKNERRWEEYLLSNKTMHQTVRFTCDSKEMASAIIKGMNSMKIPCEIVRDEDVRWVSEQNSFFRESGIRKDATDGVGICFNKLDTGAFDYWFHDYIANHYFTEEQRTFGDKLYKDPEVASYEFNIQMCVLESALKKFEEKSISIGFPANHPSNLKCKKDSVWMNCELYELPLVLSILHELRTYEYYSHQYGMNFDSTFETRRYAKCFLPRDYMQTLYVISNEPAYKGEKKLGGNMIGFDGVSRGYITTTFDPAQTPKCIPYCMVEEAGIAIHRPEWKDETKDEE